MNRIATRVTAIPGALKGLLGHCLVRDPRQRLRDIGDARFALSATAEAGAVAQAPTRPRPSRRVLQATSTDLWVQPIDGSATRQLTTFPEGKQIASFAWSPDGRQLAIARAVTTSDIVLLKGAR